MKRTDRLRSLFSLTAVGFTLVLAGCTSTNDTSTTAGQLPGESVTQNAQTQNAQTQNAQTQNAQTSNAAGDGDTSSSSSVPETAGDSGIDSAEASGDTAAPSSSAVDSRAPLATVPVPAPGGGDINQTVPSVQVSSKAPVALSEPSDVNDGVTVRLAGIESLTTTAELPGEISGPGIEVTVEIANGSQSPVSLDNVVVNLVDGARTPAIPMTASPAKPFTGEVDPGNKAQAVYVFTVPTTYKNPATITVSYAAQSPVAVFTGNAR